MAQAVHIEPTVFDETPTVAFAPTAVSPVQSLGVQPTAQPLPVWYLTPIVFIPIAAGAFIIGNVLMMIPWSIL
jgi:hypothetical protein